MTGCPVVTFDLGGAVSFAANDATIANAIDSDRGIGCKCIDDVNALDQMRRANTEILATRLGTRRVFVALYTGRKPRGVQPPLILATFCPFCGVKYVRTPLAAPVDGAAAGEENTP